MGTSLRFSGATPGCSDGCGTQYLLRGCPGAPSRDRRVDNRRDLASERTGDNRARGDQRTARSVSRDIARNRLAQDVPVSGMSAHFPVRPLCLNMQPGRPPIEPTAGRPNREGPLITARLPADIWMRTILFQRETIWKLAGAAFRPCWREAACVIGKRWAAVHPGRSAPNLPLSAPRHRRRVLHRD